MPLLRKFDEARDERGRWTAGGASLKRKLRVAADSILAQNPDIRSLPENDTPDEARQRLIVRAQLGGGRMVAPERRSLIRSSLASRASKTLIPKSYTGSDKPEPEADSWKALHVRWQVPPWLAEGQHEATKQKLINVVRSEREGAIETAKTKRQLVAVHGIKDFYTLKRRTGPLTLDPETPKGVTNRAYNHAAMLALHDFGVVDYDFKMSDAQKAELTPLIPFMRHVRRRLIDKMHIATGKGATAPYRAAFGQKFPKPKFNDDGTERVRVRPNVEFVKRAPNVALPFTLTLAKLAPAEISAAARSVQVPTPGQIKAGNYQKGHLSIGGLPIAIETPKGRFRRGVGPNGRPWAVRMPAHYGYLKQTTGADGDHVDVYLGPQAHDAAQLPVFVVDQVNARSGKFDEAKVLIGYPDRAAAMAAYDAAFSDGLGPKRRGAVCRMTWREFRGWLRAGDLTKPLALAAA